MSFSQAILRKLPTSRNSLLSVKVVSNKTFRYKRTNDNSSSTSSDNSSSSDSEKVPKKKIASDEAVAKLNYLLQQMTTNITTEKTLNLAKPSNKRVHQSEVKSVKTEPIEKQVLSAVKNVASSLGGDTKQTESELLMKLLNPVETKVESNLSDILKGMKIEREVKPAQSRANEVRKILEQVSASSKEVKASTFKKKPHYSQSKRKDDNMVFEKIDLFGNEPLGIFTEKSKLQESPQVPTWRKLHEKELKLAVIHPPANYFQQMILWTEQGKFWHFPINNEIGLDKEANVYFADHVFLEGHLDPWCPSKGPIRHFMELVCVGLSKNPYLTVEAKKEHIEWYKNYFEDKKQILQDVGAIPAGTQDEKPKSIDES